MKKLKIVFIFILILNIFVFPTTVKAETVKNLKDKLDNLLEKEKENNNNIKKTEEEIKSTQITISNIYIDMTNISDEIIKKTDEIAELEEEIKNKDEEIKELMKSLQVTMGDSFYLEYIFGAEDITDFIYRYSITEQITSHNNELIDSMNATIETNKKRNEELAAKQIELKEKQEKLKVNLNSLGTRKGELQEMEQSIEDEIKNAKDVIKMYQDAGCKDTDDINVCANKLLPPDTAFYRPFTTGYVTSEFDWRKSPITGLDESHTGIDVSNQYGTGSNIQAVAGGLVAKIYWSACGSWQVVIHHKIQNAKYNSTYSSTYLHLSKVLVKEGQIVTKETVVGLMGGARGTDTCSTGAHLHLSISYGLRYKDYWSYNDFKANLIDPRQVINFPKTLYTRWYDRVTRF